MSQGNRKTTTRKIPTMKQKFWFILAVCHSCSNYLNLEMEAECLTKKLVIFEFKYLQNKKRQKQAVKNTRIKNSYRTYPHEKINQCLTNINRCLTDSFKI